jgi:hypothetical protein
MGKVVRWVDAPEAEALIRAAIERSKANQQEP